jgi:hypothetical protein
VYTSAGLMEIRGATIHPTTDPERQTPPQGYFFAGRLWNKDFLGELSELIGGKITIDRMKPTVPDLRVLLDTNMIVFSKELLDFRGDPEAYLYVTIHASNWRVLRSLPGMPWPLLFSSLRSSSLS